MPLHIGIDLVHVPRVLQLLESPTAAGRVFLPQELVNGDPLHMAGVLAAKEAVFKALNLAPRWHEVVISSSPSGKPRAELSPSISDASIATVIDVSISHEGDYAVAVALIEVTV